MVFIKIILHIVIMFSGEAHFKIGEDVIKQNCQICNKKDTKNIHSHKITICFSLNCITLHWGYLISK